MTSFEQPTDIIRDEYSYHESVLAFGTVRILRQSNNLRRRIHHTPLLVHLNADGYDGHSLRHQRIRHLPAVDTPAGQAFTGISIGSISQAPHVTFGWMNVRNDTASQIVLTSMSQPLVAFSVAYLDFPGYPVTPMEWPVYAAGEFAIPAGSNSFILVSGALPSYLGTNQVGAYTGSGTVSTRYTIGSRTVSQQAPGLSVLDYFLVVDPTPSMVYVYDAAPAVPEPSTLACFGTAAAFALGLRLAKQRRPSRHPAW